MKGQADSTCEAQPGLSSITISQNVTLLDAKSIAHHLGLTLHLLRSGKYSRERWTRVHGLLNDYSACTLRGAAIVPNDVLEL
jgi:hypothetical protein